MSLRYSLLPFDNAKPIVPKASPPTEAPHAKKFKKKVDSSTRITIKNGNTMPKSIRSTPRTSRRRGELIRSVPIVAIIPYRGLGVFVPAICVILIQPACHKMSGFGFKVGREFHVTQARHEMRTARVEAASG